MIIFNIYLSAICRIESDDQNIIMREIGDQVLYGSLNELDEKFSSDTWCFISFLSILSEPYPEMTIGIEVDDYYYDEMITRDVIDVFKKHWKQAMKKLCGKNDQNSY